MKSLRRKLLVPLVLLVLFVAGFFWVRPSSGFATPAACVEAYYQAATAPNGAAIPPECLTPSLRNELSTKRLHDLKNWVQVGEPIVEEAKARVDVDESRQDGRQRVRYHLRKEGGGWLIDSIEPPRRLPEHVPYGTHVKEGS